MEGCVKSTQSKMNAFVKLAVILMIAGNGVSALKGTTRCSSTFLNEPAKITCAFSEDISKSSNITGISLLLYSLDDLDAAPEPVVDCYWFSEDTQRCVVKPGYEFNNIISSEMTIHIPKTTSEHEGQYLCQVDPPDGVSTCNMALKGYGENQSDQNANVERCSCCDTRLQMDRDLRAFIQQSQRDLYAQIKEAERLAAEEKFQKSLIVPCVFGSLGVIMMSTYCVVCIMKRTRRCRKCFKSNKHNQTSKREIQAHESQSLNIMVSTRNRGFNMPA